MERSSPLRSQSLIASFVFGPSYLLASKKTLPWSSNFCKAFMSSSTVPWFAVLVYIHSNEIAFSISLTLSVFGKNMPLLSGERHLFAFKAPIISLQAIRLKGMRGFGGREGMESLRDLYLKSSGCCLVFPPLKASLW